LDRFIAHFKHSIKDCQNYSWKISLNSKSVFRQWATTARSSFPSGIHSTESWSG